MKRSSTEELLTPLTGAGAVVDLVLVGAIVSELLQAQRVSQGSIKSRRAGRVMRRMVAVLFEAGFV